MRDNLVVTLGGQTYAVECPWGALPDGQKFGPVSQLAVDSQDRVYVFNRGNMPVLVFDKEGTLVRQFGNPTPWAGTTVCTDAYGNSRMRWIGTQPVMILQSTFVV